MRLNSIRWRGNVTPSIGIPVSGRVTGREPSTPGPATVGTESSVANSPLPAQHPERPREPDQLVKLGAQIAASEVVAASQRQRHRACPEIAGNAAAKRRHGSPFLPALVPGGLHMRARRIMPRVFPEGIVFREPPDIGGSGSAPRRAHLAGVQRPERRGGDYAYWGRVSTDQLRLEASRSFRLRAVIASFEIGGVASARRRRSSRRWSSAEGEVWGEPEAVIEQSPFPPRAGIR